MRAWISRSSEPPPRSASARARSRAIARAGTPGRALGACASIPLVRIDRIVAKHEDLRHLRRRVVPERRRVVVRPARGPAHRLLAPLLAGAAALREAPRDHRDADGLAPALERLRGPREEVV